MAVRIGNEGTYYVGLGFRVSRNEGVYDRGIIVRCCSPTTKTSAKQALVKIRFGPGLTVASGALLASTETTSISLRFRDSTERAKRAIFCIHVGFR